MPGGRPIRKTAAVYRVQLHRPQTGDSVIRWMTKTPEQIRQKFGKQVKSIIMYEYVKEV